MRLFDWFANDQWLQVWWNLMIELPRKPKKSAGDPNMKVGLQIWVPETYWIRAIKRAKRKKQTAEEWIADHLQANEPYLGRGG